KVINKDELRKELKQLVFGYCVHGTVPDYRVKEYRTRPDNMNYSEWIDCEVMCLILSKQLARFDVEFQKLKQFISFYFDYGFAFHKCDLASHFSTLQFNLQIASDVHFTDDMRS